MDVQRRGALCAPRLFFFSGFELSNAGLTLKKKNRVRLYKSLDKI